MFLLKKFILILLIKTKVSNIVFKKKLGTPKQINNLKNNNLTLMKSLQELKRLIYFKKY